MGFSESIAALTCTFGLFDIDRANVEFRWTGQACRTTQLDPPVALLRVEVFSTFSAARALEAQIKRWSRSKQEALIRGDWERLRKLSKSRSRSS